ncbi:MAG: type II toxin-antitoxin system Phd/YefM family antitoxin [Pseudomonadota bacterium]
MPQDSFDLRRFRNLSVRGAPVSPRISATDLRNGLREVLARIEYADERVTITRQGKPVAALIPISHLRQFEEFERTGVQYFREYLSLVREVQNLRARIQE